MRARALVTPSPGLLIRNPETQRYLPPEGELLEITPHWLRQAAAGDVSITEASSTEPAPLARARRRAGASQEA